jgi:HJR/Mrr/RecB family endonuclease
MLLLALSSLALGWLIGYALGSSSRKSNENIMLERNREILEKQKISIEKQQKDADSSWAATQTYFTEENEKFKYSINQMRSDYNEEEARRKGELRKLKEKLEKEYSDFSQMEKSFITGLTVGKEWLSEAFSTLHIERTTETSKKLKLKSNPALLGAEQVKAISLELKEWKHTAKKYEFLYKQLSETIPTIAEEISSDDLLDENSITGMDEEEIYTKLLSKEEFSKLPQEEKDQLALNKYLQTNFSKWEIGKFYERQIGYLYETEGFNVTYEGIIKGLEDFGRDIIASKDSKTFIIQCKNWSKAKIIREKHIFQLYATTIHYRIKNGNKKTTPIFVSNTSFSEEAIAVAKLLKVELKTIEFNKNYPLIKCNIGSNSKEKIYHLPFDQKYDYVQIDISTGEFYTQTVQEAVKAGFRRAKRYAPGT